MKIIITVLIINLFTYFDNNISKINEIKKEAKKNFSEKKYDQAIDKYKYLIDSMNLNDDNVMLNLSHSYLLNGDTLNAIDGYNSLTESKKGNIKSIAYQQLGVISDKYQKLKESSGKDRLCSTSTLSRAGRAASASSSSSGSNSSAMVTTSSESSSGKDAANTSGSSISTTSSRTSSSR